MTHSFIGEHELAQRRVEAGLSRCDGALRVAGRFRIGVAVKNWLDAGRAWPESTTADLVRISIARHTIGQASHAGMLGCRAAGEASAGEIERSPEEVDRAHLAGEASAKDGEDPRGLQQDAPETLRVFGVVGLVGVVLLEGNGLRDLNRHVPDVHRRVEFIERGLDLLVKRGDRHGLERYGAAAAIAGLQQQDVFDKVEVDLQHSRAVWHGRGGDAANGRVERHVPGMVDRRHEREPDLADDLHPELQGGAGIAPRGLGQSRPDVIEMG